MSILAIDIGGTGVKYALWEAEVLTGNGSFVTPATWEQMKAGLKATLHNLASCSQEPIEAVTISVPGAVDSEAGIIGGYSAIPYIHRMPFVAELTDLLGKPVFVENDANCAGLAEAFYGAAKGVKSAVSFIIGSGIGGAVVLEGKLVKGQSLFGGEFGYMLTENGQTLSELASPVQAAKRYSTQKGLVPGITGRELFDLAATGDPLAQQEVQQLHRALAIGIYNVCLVVDPEVVCLGGGLSRRKDLLAPVQAQLRLLQQQHHSEDQQITVKICQFQQDANLIGAVANYYLRKEQA